VLAGAFGPLCRWPDPKPGAASLLYHWPSMVGAEADVDVNFRVAFQEFLRPQRPLMPKRVRHRIGVYSL